VVVRKNAWENKSGVSQRRGSVFWGTFSAKAPP
jgi:hypothetical protein